MSLPDDLPLSETLGIFVGIAGFDWLDDGNAELLTAVIGAIVAGTIIFLARRISRRRKR
ncbi:MAG: hypothetical protein LWW83_00365 [Azonexaceae bacterium]|uniref:hypothetical protein n=1 Tax=Azonexus sp. R2A61 TaxID=2744443 RepID=UPI001F273AF2|nr:hypothetical protein [Azonexus sp. R2A61]MCE1238366.1 hypothetical protein [Azonexaceae bacterium]